MDATDCFGGDWLAAGGMDAVTPRAIQALETGIALAVSAWRLRAMPAGPYSAR